MNRRYYYLLLLAYCYSLLLLLLPWEYSAEVNMHVNAPEKSIAFPRRTTIDGLWNRWPVSWEWSRLTGWLLMYMYVHRSAITYVVVDRREQRRERSRSLIRSWPWPTLTSSRSTCSTSSPPTEMDLEERRMRSRAGLFQMVSSLSLCRSVYLSTYMSVCRSTCLSPFVSVYVCISPSFLVCLM